MPLARIRLLLAAASLAAAAAAADLALEVSTMEPLRPVYEGLLLRCFLSFYLHVWIDAFLYLVC